MGKYIDGSGLSHFMGILKGAFAAKSAAISNITRSGTTFTATKADGTSFTFTQQDNTVAKTTTTPKMDSGSGAIGTETKYAAGDHVHPTDTTRVPTSRKVNGKALSSDVTLYADDIKLYSTEDTNVLEVFEHLEQSFADAMGIVYMDGVPLLSQTEDETIVTSTHYAVCGTAAATAAKAVSIPTFSLYEGSMAYVKFTVTNTAAVANLTLNVNSTGAKAIKYRGGNLPSVSTLTANRLYAFVYDGTNWELVGDLDTNTHNNTFSKVKVGSTTVEADSSADTLELVAGSNVTLTPDADNDKVTIASSYTDTKNTAGSTDSSSKLFIIGATSQAANPQTYSQDTAYVGTDGHLYSNSVQVVNLSGTQALTNKTYNGYTLAAACAKGVDTSIAAGSTSANVPTTAAVVNYMTSVAGALVYKGTVGTGGTVTDLPANHTKGWYYVVKTAGTYAGFVCEAGDMIICNTNGTSANNAHWDAVQSNIEVLSNSEIDALWAAA